MSFLWMIIIGLMAGAVAKILMPEEDVRSLLILGIGGSLIAGGMLYADRQAIGFVAPVCGAVALLAIYRGMAVKPARPSAQKPAQKPVLKFVQKPVHKEEDFRRAA